MFSNNIEKIERKGIDKQILKKRSKSKTFGNWLIVKIKESRDNQNWEMAFLLQDIYKKYKEFSPEKINEIEIIEGWKGKDKPEIYRDFNEDFIIITHLKEKGGEVKKIKKVIKKENVNVIKEWLKIFKISESKKCYEVASFLGYKDWKELWKERKEYFSRYYYPIKILEKLEIIKYSGRGNITRIK
jgi:hypothetical protein